MQKGGCATEDVAGAKVQADDRAAGETDQRTSEGTGQRTRRGRRRRIKSNYSDCSDLASTSAIVLAVHFSPSRCCRLQQCASASEPEWPSPAAAARSASSDQAWSLRITLVFARANEALSACPRSIRIGLSCCSCSQCVCSPSCLSDTGLISACGGEWLTLHRIRVVSLCCSGRRADSARSLGSSSKSGCISHADSVIPSIIGCGEADRRRFFILCCCLLRICGFLLCCFCRDCGRRCRLPCPPFPWPPPVHQHALLASARVHSPRRRLCSVVDSAESAAEPPVLFQRVYERFVRADQRTPVFSLPLPALKLREAPTAEQLRRFICTFARDPNRLHHTPALDERHCLDPASYGPLDGDRRIVEFLVAMVRWLRRVIIQFRSHPSEFPEFRGSVQRSAIQCSGRRRSDRHETTRARGLRHYRKRVRTQHLHRHTTLARGGQGSSPMLPSARRVDIDPHCRQLRDTARVSSQLAVAETR